MKKALDILIDTSGSMRNPIDEKSDSISKYSAVLSYLSDVLPKIYETNLHYGICTFGSQVTGQPSAEDERGHHRHLDGDEEIRVQFRRWQAH